MILRFASGALLLILFTACSGESAKNPSGAEAINPNESNDPVVVKSVLSGPWHSNCIEGKSFSLTAQTSLGITGYSTLTVSDDLIAETAYISASPCDAKDIEIIASGKLEPKEIRRPGVRALNIEIPTYRMKPLTEFGVRISNIAKWCGFDDWALGTEKDISAAIGKKNCFSKRSFNTVYAIENGTLYFGRTDKEPSTSDQAPELNKTFYFTRR